jgi:histidine ammonia-lyase
MLGMLVLALFDLDRLVRVADVTAAMSVEALLGTDRAFADDLVALRPQPGQALSASNLRKLLAGSAVVASHRYDDPRVQDAYSLRCAPQVAGAARDVVAYAREVSAAELRSAIDNPMVMPDGRVESCGNFHGAPVGFACDFLAVAAAEVGAIAERRVDRLLDATRSQGLPPFLALEPGVDSGMMLAHYGQAAMVAENRRLAAPASVDSLPTSAMQVDDVAGPLFPVDLNPLPVRLDPLAGAHGGLHCGFDVRPRARRHATEQRGPERGSLVDLDPFQRQLERRGDDLQPQLPSGATA